MRIARLGFVLSMIALSCFLFACAETAPTVKPTAQPEKKTTICVGSPFKPGHILVDVAGKFKELVEKVPLMGICLGAQILTLSQGGDTYKLKFGHRSQNQPALDLKTNRCYITTQNHGYAIDTQCLSKTPLEPWFINANDKTSEGVKHKSKPVFAVQWHPEASPGPYDTEFLFDTFAKMMEAA